MRSSGCVRQTEFTVQFFHETNCPASTRKTCGIYLQIQSRGIRSQHEMLLISNLNNAWIQIKVNMCCCFSYYYIIIIIIIIITQFSAWLICFWITTHKKLKMVTKQMNRLHSTYMKDTYRLLGEG